MPQKLQAWLNNYFGVQSIIIGAENDFSALGCRKLEIQFDRISSFNFCEILNIANCNSKLKNKFYFIEINA